MKILQVVPTYYPAVRYGGPIRSVHGLARALVARGHRVDVYTTCMDGPGDLDVPLDRAVDVDGVAVRYFPVSPLRRLAHSPALSRALARSVSDYDVVHVHAVFQLPTVAAARAAARAGVPYVVSPRGMLMTGAIAGRRTFIKRAWIAAFERRSLREAAAVHVTAELEAAELGNLLGPGARIAVIANGLERTPAPVPLADGPFAALPRPYALLLSRISWKKGIDRLLRAWPRVRDLHLVIAGNDDEGYEGGMRALAGELGIDSRVSFVGPASDAHKWALYREAAVFVLPSYSENFGNVVVEALSVGCPVVTSTAVGACTLVEAAGAGIVIEGDEDSIVSAVSRLGSDAAAARAMGARGRAYVEEHLGWDAIAGEMETLYGSLSDRRAGR